MKLVLCPRCELNYMPDTEKLCKICLRDMNGGSSSEETELCSICNENPCVPGHDMCAVCMKEMSGSAEDDDQDSHDNVDTSGLSDMESMATMDEIIPAGEEPMPGDMENTLSLESVQEEEEKEQDEKDEEDEADEER